MTDNETIKALECCSSVDKFCTDCPLWGCERCIKKLTLYSFIFINRQKAEIERLTTAYPKTIERIKKMRDKAKAEAVKEFIERFEKEFDLVSKCNRGYILSKVNKVLKEMGVEG